MDAGDLSALGAPQALVDVWRAQVESLTEIQERAVEAGAMDGTTSLLVVAPTTSGKTFVGEMAATASAYMRRRHAIFLVPFKALAEEHYEHFRARYGHLLSVVISTSDFAENDTDVRAGNFNLAVMTYEKLSGFLVQAPDLLTRCTTLVVDEVQALGEGERGARLEMLLTQVLLSPERPQLIALSASLDEIAGLDTWLQARLVISTERPVPLTEFVCDPSGQASFLKDGEVVQRQLVDPQVEREQLLLALVEKLLSRGRQVVVFRSTVRRVHETAHRIRERLPAEGLPHELDARLNEMEQTDAAIELRRALAAGVGIHNADLTHDERQLVEHAFRTGQAKVLVSTTTLSMGVNLPCDAVIVADATRPQVDARGRFHDHDLSVGEYRNAAGRAGRLGQRGAGTSILLADSARDRRQFVDGYLLGQVEAVVSQLPFLPEFADVIFTALCGELAETEAEIVEFVASTLAYPTFYELHGGLPVIREAVKQAVDECVAAGLAARDQEVIRPTPLGKMLAGASLSFRAAVRLGELVVTLSEAPLSRNELVFEIASLPEVGDRPRVPRRCGMELDPRPMLAPDGVGCAPESALVRTLNKAVLSRDEKGALVRARCLLEWVAGESYRSLGDRFRGLSAAPSRVQALGRSAAWLLETLATAAERQGVDPECVALVRELALEARHGLPALLAPLARLQVPGITRDQLRRLYDEERDVQLHDPELILDAESDQFEGLLTPTQVTRLKQAILAEIDDTLQRRRAGHLARAEQAALPLRIVEELYTARGGGLEQAVADALGHVGLPAQRVRRQPHGEEDVRLAHRDGTVVVSVTASHGEVRPIKWDKVREVLGAGVGLNPANYVCVARPSFESLAERKAAEIAREPDRRLLLVPVPVLAEAIVRCSEARMTGDDLADLLARKDGLMTIEQLPDAAAAGEPAGPTIAAS